MARSHNIIKPLHGQRGFVAVLGSVSYANFKRAFHRRKASMIEGSMSPMREHNARLQPPTTKHPESQKGAALVEFALILPVFLSLIFGVITLSLALYNKTMLTKAVQEAARAGSIYSTDAKGLAITDAARQTKATNAFTAACGNYLILMNPTPTTTPFISGDPYPSPRFINVSTNNGTFNANLYIFKSYAISANAIMRIEE